MEKAALQNKGCSDRLRYTFLLKNKVTHCAFSVTVQPGVVQQHSVDASGRVVVLALSGAVGEVQVAVVVERGVHPVADAREVGVHGPGVAAVHSQRGLVQAPVQVLGEEEGLPRGRHVDGCVYVLYVGGEAQRGEGFGETPQDRAASSSPVPTALEEEHRVLACKGIGVLNIFLKNERKKAIFNHSRPERFDTSAFEK